MNIAINTRFLLKGKMEGFGWYTYEVSKRLVEKNPEHTFYFFFDRPFDDEFVFAENVVPIVLFPPARHPFLFVAWFEWAVTKALKKHKIDLFFSPDGYLSLRSKVPQVNVIHDINFEHFPEDIPWLASKYLRYFLPKFANKATEILTVSHYSKSDIAKCYDIDLSKISVAWNGVSEEFKVISFDEIQAVRKEFSGGQPYFLFVGSIHPRKNLNRLLEAYETYCQKAENKWEMVIVGESMWSSSAVEVRLTELTKKRIKFTGRLALKQLAKVTASAGAMTYVPYFEGFGIPLVEAMRCGVPILAGNLTSLPEVAGDAAVYCNPMKVDSIYRGMEKISHDQNLRNELSEKGLRRSAQFSWDFTAEKVWEVLKRNLLNSLKR